MFGGICQYLIGFYDWYQGKTMVSLVDFIFGLLHLAYFFTADLGKYSICQINIILVCKESFIFYSSLFYFLLLLQQEIQDAFILFICFYLL